MAQINDPKEWSKLLCNTEESSPLVLGFLGFSLFLKSYSSSSSVKDIGFQMLKKTIEEKKENEMKKIEIETVISFNDEDAFAQISTRQKRVKSRMAKLGVNPHHKQGDYECFRVSKRWIRINAPRKVSDKQRETARRNLLKSP